MRNIIVSEFLSLDGVMEDPGGSERTKYGGWSFQFFSDDVGRYKQAGLFAADALLLGRVTYQGFAAAWPSVTDETGFADRMNNVPKYVVSTTLNELTWHNSKPIKANVAEEVFQLKQQPGQDILIAGSRRLVHSLMPHGLVDEYRLMVHPVVRGTGKRLFDEETDKTVLKLTNSTTFPSGIVVLSYRPAGRLTEPPDSRAR
jgi:dihydrofolate reductase